MKQGEVISVPYCIHLALHIVRYVRTLNVSYSKLSAFGYENFLSELVPTLRSTNCLLEQIVNRQQERDLYLLAKNPDGTFMRDENGKLVIGWGGWRGNSKITDADTFVLNDSKKHPVFEYKNISVSTRFADSWVLVCSDPHDPSTFENPLIFHCTHFVKGGATSQEPAGNVHESKHLSSVYLRGYFYPEKHDLYSEPYPSSLKFEYVFSNKPNAQLAELPIESIMYKLYVYPRFSMLPLDVLTIKDLGEEFDKVPERIGVALRH